MIELNKQRLDKKKRIYLKCMEHVPIPTTESLPYMDPLRIKANPAEVFIHNVPQAMLPVFYVICKAFPELKNTHISLRFQSISMTMQARPNIWTLMQSERSYFIFINTHRQRNGILYQDIPFNAKVGIVAHEMCHILDYHYKSNWKIIKTGLWYLKKRNQENYEKAIDYLTIQKGFGHQLRDWSDFVLHHAPISPKYRDTKKSFYLHPIEIDHFVDDLHREPL